MENRKTLGFSLNQNTLKLIACLSMALDHIGYELFPELLWLRILGRLAFPLFAYFIYEGARHTRDISRYFLRVFSLAVICFIAFDIIEGRLFGNILITFSFSILLLYAVRLLQEERLKGIAALLLVTILLLLFERGVGVDYGITGVFLPVVPAVMEVLRKRHDRILCLLDFSVCLLIVSFSLGSIEYFSLFSIPLLFFYNGQRGSKRLTAFFYLFYPLHLVLIGIGSIVFFHRL